ncbi:serine hydrolase domain-containing protein [Acidisoma sp. 7E03]
MIRPETTHPALDALLDRVIAERRLVGAAVLLFRDGQPFYEKAVGLADREAERPMTMNTVFRLASMTKPIVSVTTLALAEAGLLTLDDPVTRFLPEFHPKTPDGAVAEIRIRHLLSHTAGLSYGFLQPEPSAYVAAGISDGLDAPGITLAENLRRLAGQPLRFAPGTAWHYSLATDVLGAVLEAASGQSLPDLVSERITQPLGMTETRFRATAATPLATPYADPAAPGEAPRRMTEPFVLHQPDPALGEVHYSPSRAYDVQAYPTGGAGMIGTAADYMRFLEALRGGGAPILSAASTAALVGDAIPDLATDTPGWGFGLGVACLRDPAAGETPQNPGAWGWGGAFGTSFWVDPAAGLSAVALTNTALEGTNGPFTRELVRAAYA